MKVKRTRSRSLSLSLTRSRTRSLSLSLPLLALAGAAATVPATATAGVQYGAYTLEAAVGSGANTSLCVLDFTQTAGGGGVHGFAYHWDGAAGSQTGKELIDALHNLDVDGDSTPDLLFSYDPATGWMESISYKGATISNGLVDDTWYAYSSYYVSGGSTVNDSVAPPVVKEYPGGGEAGPVWGMSDSGFASRLLADGSWDGWTQSLWNNDTWEEVNVPPSAPFASVPEPTAGGLLLALGAAVSSRRRWWHGRG
ncbi:MAG: PEP-CTERM sorting domain-containing protein [Lentisphaeria bacterium]|jgi:hypothetical protein